MFAIRPVLSDKERLEVFQLRYSVIVREQHFYPVDSVSSADEVVIDGADCNGHIFAGWHRNNLVGTIRVNILNEGPALPFSDLLNLPDLTHQKRANSSITSRLVVSLGMRHSPLSVRLIQTAYRFYLQRDVRWDYILALGDEAKMFTRLGYVNFGDRIEYAGYGLVQPMRIEVDPIRLGEIGSILARFQKSS